MKPVKKYKIARRLGAHVFEKTQTEKFAASVARRKRPTKRPKPLSGYAEQMYEKQRIKFAYALLEKQFASYVKKSMESKKELPTAALGTMLESRLDSIVYRLGFAPTKRMARQMVSHGHFCVNGVKSTVASTMIKIGDTISVREGSKKSTLFADIANRIKDYSVPSYLSFNVDTLTATLKGKPVLMDSAFDFNKVIEFYSR